MKNLNQVIKLQYLLIRLFFYYYYYDNDRKDMGNIRKVVILAEVNSTTIRPNLSFKRVNNYIL